MALGQGPQLALLHRAGGGEALQVPTLDQGRACRRVEVGSSEPPGPGWGRSGPSGALWPSGTQGRVGGGCGSAGHLALPPEPAAVEGVLNDSSVYRWPWSQREAALPPGSWPQRTQQSAFVGGLTRPRKERCTHWVLASLLTAFPPRGGRAPSPTVSLGKQPGPAPPQGLPWESG